MKLNWIKRCNFNFETMREYNRVSGKSVNISRMFVNVRDLDQGVVGKEKGV